MMNKRHNLHTGSGNAGAGKVDRRADRMVVEAAKYVAPNIYEPVAFNISNLTAEWV